MHGLTNLQLRNPQLRVSPSYPIAQSQYGLVWFNRVSREVGSGFTDGLEVD